MKKGGPRGRCSQRARSRKILRLLAVGESNPQIVNRLCIGVGTVNWHTKNIYKKLDVRNRTEAAALRPRSRLALVHLITGSNSQIDQPDQMGGGQAARGILF